MCQINYEKENMQSSRYKQKLFYVTLCSRYVQL